MHSFTPQCAAHARHITSRPATARRTAPKTDRPAEAPTCAGDLSCAPSEPWDRCRLPRPFPGTARGACAPDCRGLRQPDVGGGNAAVAGFWRAVQTAHPAGSRGFAAHDGAERGQGAGRRAFVAQRSGRPLRVITIDVDHFKRVNDTCGHEMGDNVLRSLALQLKARLRISAAVARLGGEEFIVLLPDTPLADALVHGARAGDSGSGPAVRGGGPCDHQCRAAGFAIGRRRCRSDVAAQRRSAAGGEDRGAQLRDGPALSGAGGKLQWVSMLQAQGG